MKTPVMFTTAIGSAQVFPVQTDLTCLYGAQLAYDTPPWLHNMPRFLVIPPASALHASRMSLSLHYTIFLSEYIDRYERERIEREREEQQERDDLRHISDAYTTVFILGAAMYVTILLRQRLE